MNPAWIPAVVTAAGAVMGVWRWLNSWSSPEESDLATALSAREVHMRLASELQEAGEYGAAVAHRERACLVLAEAMERSEHRLTPRVSRYTVLGFLGYGASVVLTVTLSFLGKENAPRAVFLAVAWIAVAFVVMGVVSALVALSLSGRRSADVRRLAPQRAQGYPGWRAEDEESGA